MVYTADTKHADKIMEDMGIEVGSKPLNCPAMTPDEENDESDEVKLSRCEAKDFRRLGMTANYLAMDRPDIQFAVNQICREMSIPKVAGLRKLKKLARYLRGALEVEIHFRAEGDEAVLETFTDSD